MVAKAELEIRAQIKELNAGLKKTQKELKGVREQSVRTNKTMQQNVGQTNQTLTKMKGLLISILTITAFTQLTRNIIAIRGEFQRFNAVLTNTLGSAEEANREFAKIQKFAAETPFSVRELTASFVKLINQGFKPTTEEMRKLGDLAAALGKSFDQLTEALIDAQVGEFERLKEFGILARKSGDEVKFTFKEVETTVKFTRKAIQEYILTLGDLQGVTGGMDKISKTLEGRVSNLGDAWDSLMDTMGGRTEGIMFGIIDGIGMIIQKVQEFLELTDPTKAGRVRGGAIIRMLTGEDGELDTEQVEKELAFFVEKLEGVKDDILGVGVIEAAFGKEAGDRVRAANEALINEYQGIVEVLQEALKAVGDETVVLDENLRTIKTLQKEIKLLNEEKLNLSITDTERIAEINLETAALKNQIKELENLGKVTKPVTKEDIETLKLEQEEADEIFAISSKLAQDEIDLNNKVTDEKKKNSEEIQAILLRDAEERRRLAENELLEEKERGERRKEIIQAAAETAASIATDVLNLRSDNLRVQLDKDLKAVGDNEEKKLRECKQRQP